MLSLLFILVIERLLFFKSNEFICCKFPLLFVSLKLDGSIKGLFIFKSDFKLLLLFVYISVKLILLLLMVFLNSMVYFFSFVSAYVINYLQSL